MEVTDKVTTALTDPGQTLTSVESSLLEIFLNDRKYCLKLILWPASIFSRVDEAPRVLFDFAM